MGEKISVAQAARLIGRQERLLRGWIANGKLAATKTGQAWVIDLDDLARVPGVRIDQEQLAALADGAIATSARTSASQRIMDLEQEIVALRQRLEGAEHQITASAEQVAALQQRLDAAGRDIATQERHMATFSQRLDATERSVATHQRAVAALQRQLETVEQDATAAAGRGRWFSWLWRAGMP